MESKPPLNDDPLELLIDALTTIYEIEARVSKLRADLERIID